MDRELLISKLDEAIKNSVGDDGRNQYLIKRIKQKKELLKSDKKYIEKILKIKIDSISDKDLSNRINRKNNQIFQNQNLVKCSTCNDEIKLDNKSIRENNKWYHSQCFQKSTFRKHKKSIINDIESRKTRRKGKDPIQFIITGIIFVFFRFYQKSTLFN